METKPLIVGVAELIADTFPELEGRALPVSEVQAFKDKTNIPTLPVAIVALIGESSEQGDNGGGSFKLTDDVVVEFMFKPSKYTKEDGTDTPFFSYYDFESIRNQLLAATLHWRSCENGGQAGGLAYKSGTVESDEFAVYISFRFTSTYTWELTDEQRSQIEIPSPLSVLTARVLQPKSTIPCGTDNEVEPADPCGAIPTTSTPAE